VTFEHNDKEKIIMLIWPSAQRQGKVILSRTAKHERRKEQSKVSLLVMLYLLQNPKKNNKLGNVRIA
jgi:hypothetical protein